MAIAHAGLDLRPFFVIIPRRDHQEGNRMLRIIVTVEQFQRVFEGLAATPVHMPVQAPRRLRVIESRPDAANNELVGPVLHLVVKLFQVILAPVLPLRVPSVTRMYPRVIAVKVMGVLLWGIVLIDQYRRMVPLADCLPDPVPIGIAALRKDEDDGPALIGHIRLVAW